MTIEDILTPEAAYKKGLELDRREFARRADELVGVIAQWGLTAGCDWPYMRFARVAEKIAEGMDVETCFHAGSEWSYWRFR